MIYIYMYIFICIYQIGYIFIYNETLNVNFTVDELYSCTELSKISDLCDLK